MASLRDADITTKGGGQGVMTVIDLAAAVTSDTITFKGPVRGFIPVNRTTADAISVSYSYTTQLFTVVVANTPDISIIVIH